MSDRRRFLSSQKDSGNESSLMYCSNPKKGSSTRPRNAKRRSLRKLFVGHLPKSISPEELYVFLCQYCPILYVRLIQDDITGENKGCAFVYVDSDEKADSLIRNLDCRVCFRDQSKYMNVSYALQSHECHKQTQEYTREPPTQYSYYGNAPMGMSYGLPLSLSYYPYESNEDYHMMYPPPDHAALSPVYIDDAVETVTETTRPQSLSPSSESRSSFHDDAAFLSPSILKNSQRPLSVQNRSCQTSPSKAPFLSFNQSEESFDGTNEDERNTTPISDAKGRAFSDTNAMAFSDTNVITLSDTNAVSLSDVNGYAFSDTNVVYSDDLSDTDSDIQTTSLPEIHPQEDEIETKVGVANSEESAISVEARCQSSVEASYQSSGESSYQSSVETNQDSLYTDSSSIQDDSVDDGPRRIDCYGYMNHSTTVAHLPPGYTQDSQAYVHNYSQSYYPIPPGVPLSTPQLYQNEPLNVCESISPSSLHSNVYVNETAYYSPYVTNITPTVPPYGSYWVNRADDQYTYPTHTYSCGYYQTTENRNTRKEGPPGANLFIYNIPVTFTKADLKSLFSSYGHIVSAKVCLDKCTGKSRGYGFVSYDSALSARLAIESMDGAKVNKKVLQVRLRIEKH